jgi:hypothetical protein
LNNAEAVHSTRAGGTVAPKTGAGATAIHPQGSSPRKSLKEKAKIALSPDPVALYYCYQF